MTRLILVRHGETLWNRESRFQGQLDIELSHDGRHQAVQTAARLANEKVDIVYSSDLKRASETADIIAKPRDIRVVKLPALRERSWGEWEGLTTAEAYDRYPEIVRQWREGNTSATPPGGETIRQMSERALTCIHEIVRKHPAQTVLIVGHGACLKTVISELTSLPRSNFRFDNGSVTVIEVDGERRIIHVLNETSHTRVADGTETDSTGLNGKDASDACQKYA